MFPSRYEGPHDEAMVMKMKSDKPVIFNVVVDPKKMVSLVKSGSE
jgi:hypothetical protein